MKIRPSVDNIRRLPLRLAPGLFLINSGVGKLGLDEASAAGLQAMAGNAIPQVHLLSPAVFGKTLAAGEIALGTALLTPMVRTGVAGAGLTAFSAGLLRMYARTPGMHENLRPTQDGTAIAKDSWLLGIGLSLIVDALAGRGRKDKEDARGDDGGPGDEQGQESAAEQS